MASCDIVVVAASAGGVTALRDLVARLPAELRSAVLIVLHIPAQIRSYLPGVLDRSGPLPARPARDDDPLIGGQVLVAPPDRHLVVAGARLRLSTAARENGVRPAADPLLRSAASCYGPRVCAVVLSGTRSDGAAGSACVQRCGGVVLVQDPAEAAFGEMPVHALASADTAQVLSVADIAARIVGLVGVRGRIDRPPPARPWSGRANSAREGRSCELGSPLSSSSCSTSCGTAVASTSPVTSARR